MVVAGAIVGIVFLVYRQQQQEQRARSKSQHDDHHHGGEGADAKLQAQANEVAVKAGCPASTKTRGEQPEVRLGARR